jgi:hypothetical protein
MDGALFDKRIIAYLVKKSATFYGTRKFISIYKSPILDPILSHITPFHIPMSCFKIPSQLHSSLIHSCLPDQNTVRISHLFRAPSTCLDYMILIISGEAYKLQISSLCSCNVQSWFLSNIVIRNCASRTPPAMWLNNPCKDLGRFRYQKILNLI